jgi:putative methyltransferase (TIGR04325 family)
MLAPVVVFCYKRAKHLERVINALKINRLSTDTDLIIYCDGSKGNVDKHDVDVVRNYVTTITGFNSINVVYRDVNFGLTRNIEDGITETLKKYCKVIVLEDDILVTPVFLEFMNDALTAYSNDMNVSCVSGYTYIDNPDGDHFFLKGAECWGWGTWSRAWMNYERDVNILYSLFPKNKYTKHKIGFGTNFYFRMLKKTAAGHLNSWAIKWNVSCFLKDLYTIYPARSFVYNIGLDSTGEHGKMEDDLNLASLNFRSYKLEHKNPKESELMYKQFSVFFKKRFSFSGKLLSLLRKLRLRCIQNIKLNCNDLFLVILNLIFNRKFKGKYSSFAQAALDSSGYNDNVILDRVTNITEMRKNRLIISERDGFILHNIEIPIQIKSFIQSLLFSNRPLQVLDFGGGLGSWYFDFVDIFGKSSVAKWLIIEQENFVKSGSKNFEDGTLNFNEYAAFDLIPQKFDFVVFSSVIQYLENPYEVLSEIYTIDVPYLIINRTPFWIGEFDRCAIQRNKSFGESYPSWILSEPGFKKFIHTKWEILDEFYSSDNQHLLSGLHRVRYKSFILKKITI